MATELERLDRKLLVTNVDMDGREVGFQGLWFCPYCGLDLTKWRKKLLYRHVKDCIYQSIFDAYVDAS
jgi:hypothetical protein